MSIDNPHGAAERLKNDIDRGKAGDTVKWPDPAPTPLGTDNEASGIMSPEHAIEADRGAAATYPEDSSRRTQGRKVSLILLAFILAGTAALLSVILGFRI